MAKLTRETQIPCPHCGGTINETRICDTEAAGVDAFGKKAGEKFTPIDTATMPRKPPAPAKKGRYYPETKAWTAGTLSNGVKVKKGDPLLAHNANDGSDADLFRKEFPRVPCGDR